MSSVMLKDWRLYPSGKEKYQLYLASREWAILKEAVRQRSGGTCERCKAIPAGNVHHQTYERVYAEHLEDLVHLCVPCHEFESGKRGRDPKLDVVPDLKGIPVTSVYLAGKITQNQWRNEIAPGWSVENHGLVAPEILHTGIWGTIPAAVALPDGRRIGLTGPFWKAMDGGGHCDAEESTLPHSYDVFSGPKCLEASLLIGNIYGAIWDASLVFAWIDSFDCFGTIAEIGFARSEGKPVVVACPTDFAWSDLWLVFHMADIRIRAACPADAWRLLWTTDLRPLDLSQTDFLDPL